MKSSKQNRVINMTSLDKFKRKLLYGVLFVLFIPSHGLAQEIRLNFKNISVKDALWSIEKQGKFTFLYDAEELDSAGNISRDTVANSIEEALQICLSSTNLTFTIQDEVIVIKQKVESRTVANSRRERVEIKGSVSDSHGGPLPGATIRLKGSDFGASSDENGFYTLSIPAESFNNASLLFSFIGMKQEEVKVAGRSEIDVVLEDDIQLIGEAFVTGYFERKKESFTGAMTSFKGDELMAVNNQNVLASLSTISPSFKLIENNLFGNDPNRIPDFQIRGGSSLTTSLEADYTNSPNMPTFILDGFEVSAEKVFDLDPNRVEDITILKDAAATAIYGSRAANGVVVIETKGPKMGEMRVSYSLNLDFDVADLTDYNLMNAKEKLEYERLAGLYSHSTVYVDDLYKQKYNEKLKLVSQGIDTDWLSKPVKNVGVSTKHSLLLEGGDASFRYGIDVNYSTKAGVMRGSGRDKIGIGVTLQYNYKSVKFINTLSYDNVKQFNSPYGEFSQYTYLNPYYYPYETGGAIKEYLHLFSDGTREVNPLYNTTLNIKDIANYNNFTNNFSLEWKITEDLKFNARVALVKQNGGSDYFKPAEHTDFIDLTNKGLYQKMSSDDFSYDANAVLYYNKIIGKHHLNVAGIYNIYETKSDSYVIVGQNYPNSNMDHVGMGTSYLEGGRPIGYHNISRLIGLVSSANYSYDNRFLFDFSLRGDASSLFGSNKRWGLFFASGVGWNIHNEQFMSGISWIDELKLRGSWGETGGIKFNPFQSMMMFSYNDADISGLSYNNRLGALLMALGNPNLQWQKKEKINFGVDFEFFKRRISGSVNLYEEISKNQLVDVTLAPSLGFPTYMENLGKVKNRGIELALKGTIWKSIEGDKQLDLFTNIFTNKNRLIEINNALTAFNDKQDQLASDESNPINKPMVKYQEGLSMNTIWAVRSLGIDQATGREIFVDRHGGIVSNYDFKDQIPVGCTDPKIEGNFGASFYYKGFQFASYFLFKYGGDLYNQTLVDKVENVKPELNGDRRILNNRWKNPGDEAHFKSIRDKSITNPTSRFVEKDNELRFTSLSLSYEFNRTQLKKLGVDRLKVGALANDLFRINSSKVERGIYYPFSRYFSLSAQVTF